jgi:hypothetical protein
LAKPVREGLIMAKGVAVDQVLAAELKERQKSHVRIAPVGLT